MTNLKNNIFRFLPVTLIFFSILALPLCAEDQNKHYGDNYPPQEVKSLPIPEQLDFAGEVVPLERHDLRERFDREMLAFTFMHSTTFLLIKRANLYFPIIEPILKENNVPDDFKYLALIESYFNPRAVSPAKAAGFWQFLSSTGKEYGLEVGTQVDERFHIEKSTAAACQYLKDSYELYNSWITAAAAYNAGKNRISTELEQQNAKDYFDLYLNEETSRYVFRLLAAKEMLTNPQKYGFNLKKQDFYHTVRTRNVVVNTSIEDWADWAADNGTTYVQLKYFNPWIRDRKLDNKSGKTYTIKIPYPEDINYDIDKVKIHNKNWIK